MDKDTKGINEMSMGELIEKQCQLEEYPEVKSYLELQKLSEEELAEVKAKIDEYYQKCWDSEAGTRFKLGREVLHMQNPDWKALKHFAKEAEEAIEKGDYMEKPKLPDIYEISNSKIVLYYLAIISKIKVNEVKKNKDTGYF